MKVGYVNQERFIELEKASFVKLAKNLPDFKRHTYTGEHVSFNYYKLNFGSDESAQADLYFLPYAVDLDAQRDAAFSSLYHNFFLYYKRPTIVITFVGMKFKAGSKENVYSILADELVPFFKHLKLVPTKILGASMGARAAIDAGLRFSKPGREIYLYELPGLNETPVLLDFNKTLLLDKHYNLHIKQGEFKGSRALNRGKNYVRTTKRFLTNINSESKFIKSISTREFLKDIRKLCEDNAKVHVIVGEDSHLTNQAKQTLKELKDADNLYLTIVSELGHFTGKNVAAINRLTEEICVHDITKHKAYQKLEL